MAIRVVCPNGHLLKVKDRYAGRDGRCPICRAPIKIPDPKAEYAGLEHQSIMDILQPHIAGMATDEIEHVDKNLSQADKWQIAARYLYDLLNKEVNGDILKDLLPKKNWEEAVKKIGEAEEGIRFPTGER